MSRNCKVALAVFLSLSANAATMAAGVSVLFVGNSLTQANDLPTVFKRLAAQSALHVDVDVNSLTVFPRRLFCFQPGRDRPAIRTIKTLPRADLPPKCKRD